MCLRRQSEGGLLRSRLECLGAALILALAFLGLLSHVSSVYLNYKKISKRIIFSLTFKLLIHKYNNVIQ